MQKNYRAEAQRRGVCEVRVGVGEWSQGSVVRGQYAVVRGLGHAPSAKTLCVSASLREITNAEKLSRRGAEARSLRGKSWSWRVESGVSSQGSVRSSQGFGACPQR